MKHRVTWKRILEVEFDDEEMRKHGYKGEITDDMRKDYFDRLLEDEYLENLNMYDEIEVTEVY